MTKKANTYLHSLRSQKLFELLFVMYLEKIDNNEKTTPLRFTNLLLF
jgi:hypothetical protein